MIPIEVESILNALKTGFCTGAAPPAPNIDGAVAEP